jgi:serine/threonine-protein kinase/endoribonuclease IRE1
LRDASDRVELEDREEGSALLAAMEGVGQSGNIGLWDAQLDKALLENLGKYRRYNSRSIRDLLRVIRNKCNHYRELPQSVKVRGMWGRSLLSWSGCRKSTASGVLEAIDRAAKY